MLRWPSDVAAAAAARAREPERGGPRGAFGLEYRVFLGRLEFNVDTETRSQSFRADEGIHTLIVENRSSDTSGTVSCKLTSITIRPE
jgi:hypothetical protein